MGRSFRWPWPSNGNAASIIDAARTNAFAGIFGDIIPPAEEGGDILRRVYGVGAKIIFGSSAVANGRVGSGERTEGSAKNPPKGKFVRGVFYVAAKAATHKAN